MTAHLSWETINDHADRRLPADELAMANAHLATCAACRAQLASLRALLATAGSASDQAAPPADAWAELQRTIQAKKSISFPHEPSRARSFHISRSRLAAAALLLIGASSALTAIALREPAPAGSAAGGTPVLATEYAAVEREYLSTATELGAALDKQRSTLSPSTIATVERSLRVIDDAIAEAREALLRDPANDALRELLRRNHQQKIDFLRRTTALLQKA